MCTTTRTFGAAAILTAFVAMPLAAQAERETADPMITSAKDAFTYMGDVLTRAADQMPEEDYAFKPTPEVRSFGQLLAHVADSNYLFCSAARGEERPVRDVEATATGKGEIQQALAESLAYCEGAYEGLTEARAESMVPFMGEHRPVLVVLFFSTHHAALHYGNAITYMRLRGKVPPSSQEPAG